MGAYALAAHGVPRATGDIDLWVRPTPANAVRVLRALKRFGAPLFGPGGEGLEVKDLATPGKGLMLGIPPHRIDISTAIDGVDFADAWKSRISFELEEVPVQVIGRAALLLNKRAAARPKDLLDVATLERHPPVRSGPKA